MEPREQSKPSTGRIKLPPFLNANARRAEKIMRLADENKIDMKEAYKVTFDTNGFLKARQERRLNKPSGEMPFGEVIVDPNHPYKFLQGLRVESTWNDTHIKDILLPVYEAFRTGTDYMQWSQLPEDARAWVMKYVEYLDQQATQAIKVNEKGVPIEGSATVPVPVEGPTISSPDVVSPEVVEPIIEQIDRSYAKDQGVSPDVKYEIMNETLSPAERDFIASYINMKQAAEELDIEVRTNE